MGKSQVFLCQGSTDGTRDGLIFSNLCYTPYS